MNKKKLVFATSNPHKIKEVNTILQGLDFEVIAMGDIGVHEEIEETGTTLTENAWIKADYIYDKFQVDCFSEDSGLEIDSLDGEPGVYTARYGGIEKDHDANMDKVLKNLQDKEDRSAQFRTIIAMIIDGRRETFEGIIRGKIAMARQGKDGFGYDPIFIPENYDYSFAQLPSQVKAHISHRARALNQMLAFLAQNP